jgi:tRNA A-37 threonylcarbamoyl transferase component Bud32
LAQLTEKQREKLAAPILEFSRHLAGTGQIRAACIYGDSHLRQTATKSIVQVLLVIDNFQAKLVNYAKILAGRNVAILAVDDWIFERDIDRGFLGEALAWRLIPSYAPLLDEGYLRFQEVKLKKRLILELLENLVLDFPELSQEFLIKPDYFVYEAMLSRVRLFPPIIKDVSEFLREDAREENVRRTLIGYRKALKDLEEEGEIMFNDDYVKISEKFVSRARSPRKRLLNLSKTVPRALFTSALGIFPRMLETVSQGREALSKLQSIGKNAWTPSQSQDPENYVFVPTASGLVPLSSRLDIEATARMALSMGKDERIEIEAIGGILNDVFLVKASTKSGEKKLVAKRFKDWSSFKWFPLALWSIGTRTFAILGRSRLERECAVNRLLHSKGFDVPTLRYVSSRKRLILMDYVEGETATKTIKALAEPKRGKDTGKNVNTIESIGRKLAKVHAVGVALGDTKSENIIIDKNGRVYMFDFEQASRRGDQAWDVAEFLYFAGHDVAPPAQTRNAELVAQAFISGYLDGGGKAETVKKAAGPKYTKVFSFFTLPRVILAISNACKKAGS